MVLTDLDYADDISLLSDNVEQAQELLHRVELECAKVGLRLNAKKTEVLTYNVSPEHQPLITAGGTVLKEVEDFKYRYSRTDIPNLYRHTHNPSVLENLTHQTTTKNPMSQRT